MLEMDGFDMINMRQTCSCCGLICVRRTCLRAFISCFYKTMKYYAQIVHAQYNHIWMVNSFWGLDEPRCLPPNITLTGPLTRQSAPYMERLREKDTPLYNWLQDALEKKENVVVLTLGSVCKWQPWSINAVYSGLKNIGCRVVWSLKDEWLSILDENPKENPKFWVSSWIPQIEVLNHRAVKAGMTHCGWGGCLEFVGAGVPVVTFPHFGDQPINSNLLVERKAAVLLHQQDKNPFDFEGALTYKDVAFDHKKVEKCFNLVLNDPSYKENMHKL